MADLSSDERAGLHKILLEAFPQDGDFKKLSAHLYGDRVDRFSPQLGVDIRLDGLIAEFDDRGRILDLLQNASETPGWAAYPRLRQKLAEFRAGWEKRKGITPAILDNPYQACQVDQGRPFINRKDLRDHIKELRERNRRFLVVNGPPGSGKTYSIYFLNYLQSLAGFKVSFVELAREVRTQYYPDILARRIAGDLSLPTTEPIPMQQNVGDRWAQEICDWLVDRIQRAGPNLYWIVLDGFSNPDLPDETRQIVHALIDAVDKRPALAGVRLVLLDYPLPLPADIRPLVKKETLQLITPVELTGFFEKFFEQANIEYDKKSVTRAVKRVLKNLPENDPKERMATIMANVWETLEALSPEQEP